MRLVFAGTPAVAVPGLTALAASSEQPIAAHAVSNFAAPAAAAAHS